MACPVPFSGNYHSDLAVASFRRVGLVTPNTGVREDGKCILLPNDPFRLYNAGFGLDLGRSSRCAFFLRK